MEARQIARSKLGNRMMPEWDAIHADDFKMAVALDAGDVATVKQMQFNEQRDMVNAALEDNFDTSVKTSGALADRGKLLVKPKQIHGLSSSPESINGYLMTFDSMKNGRIRDDVETANDAALRKAAQATLAPNAVAVLAKPGLRDGVAVLSDENRKGRAEDRVVDFNNKVDRNTGVLLAGMPTDGGHGDNFPHEKFPEYSNARWNMGTEQGYINKTKGNRTGLDAMQAMRNGIRNKMHADESGDVIRSVAKGWQVGEGFGPMEDDMTAPKTMRESLAAQDAQRYKDDYVRELTSIDGQPLEEGAGVGHTSGNEGKVVKLNVNTQGGDFHLDTEMSKRKMA